MKQKPVFQPLSTLKLGTAVLAFPFAIGFLLSMKLISLFTRSEPLTKNDLPPNAIFYSTHLDVISAAVNPVLQTPSLIVVGYHAFLAYVYIGWDRFAGIGHLCYDREGTPPPLDQIQAMFQNYPNHYFWIFTDSGGPYGRVRKSLVILSRESGRPVVACRLTPTRYFKLLGHRIPLPFARIKIAFSRPVTAGELSALSVEAGRDRLQASLDSLNDAQ